MPTAFSAICEVYFVPGLLRFHKDMSYFSFILPLTPNYMILMLFFEIHFEICFYSLVSLLTVRPILFIWDFKKQSIPFCFVFLKVLLGGFKCLGWTTNSRRGQIVYIYLYAFQSWSLLTLSSIRLASVLACEMFRYVFQLSHYFLVIEIWFLFTEPVAWLLPRVRSACVSVCASVCFTFSSWNRLWFPLRSVLSWSYYVCLVPGFFLTIGVWFWEEGGCGRLLSTVVSWRSLSPGVSSGDTERNPATQCGWAVCVDCPGWLDGAFQGCSKCHRVPEWWMLFSLGNQKAP